MAPRTRKPSTVTTGVIPAETCPPGVFDVTGTSEPGSDHFAAAVAEEQGIGRPFWFAGHVWRAVPKFSMIRWEFADTNTDYARLLVEMVTETQRDQFRAACMTADVFADDWAGFFKVRARLAALIAGHPTKPSSGS